MDKILIAAIKANRETLERLQKDLAVTKMRQRLLKEVSSSRKLWFHVSLKSIWRHEINVAVMSKGPLKRVIREAEEEFGKKNSRDNLQVRYSVYFKIGDTGWLSLPGECWGHLIAGGGVATAPGLA